MIEGQVNELGEPIVSISLRGLVKEVNAILDTGFNGALWLSKDDLADIAELEVLTTENFQLADGSLIEVAVGIGKLKWFGKEREVETVISPSTDALLGTELLEDCKLQIDFKQGQVQIEKA